MFSTQSNVSNYRGRFAPSPTGPLHFGSLVAAIGSYLDAKFNKGEWLVRIEDLDPPRTVPGASDDILTTLEKLGMEWDGEVIFQSQRNEAYQAGVSRLSQTAIVYPCTCSRKEIADASTAGIDGHIYPGTCREKVSHVGRSAALRLTTHQQPIQFTDALRGAVCQCLERDVGDFVLRRADGVYTYQLAVVVDDAAQNITHVVRGIDLLDSTPRQIYLQLLLGYTTPRYMHLPVVTNAQGEKLSKQTLAAPIDLSNALSQMIAALQFLGQNPPKALQQETLATFWQWAIENWRVDKIP